MAGSPLFLPGHWSVPSYLLVSTEKSRELSSLATHRHSRSQRPLGPVLSRKGNAALLGVHHPTLTHTQVPKVESTFRNHLGCKRGSPNTPAEHKDHGPPTPQHPHHSVYRWGKRNPPNGVVVSFTSHNWSEAGLRQEQVQGLRDLSGPMSLCVVSPAGH